MKKTFKLLSVLLLSVILFSCNYVPTEQTLPEPYRVVSIERFAVEPNDYPLCKYEIKTADYIRWFDKLVVVDSIGKFKIGDEVYFTLNKVKK